MYKLQPVDRSSFESLHPAYPTPFEQVVRRSQGNSQQLINSYTKHVSSVQEIVSSMVQAGITGLFYTRIYPDGTVLNLPSDASWVEFYLTRLHTGCYQNSDLVDQFFTYSGIGLWTLNPKNPAWQDAKHYFGYSSGISISNDHSDYREVIVFYSNKDPQKMNHFYMNHIDALKKMKQYFLSRSETLIQKAEEERQVLRHKIFLPLEFDCFLPKPDNASFKSETMVLMHKKTGLPVKLPPQREKCFVYLLQGNSIKKIAKFMQLSPRTVECYINILRQELGCHSVKDVIVSYANKYHLYAGD
jgi:DNA-binding NarL/FixJ family response regulator